jgi:high affinity Mn2+ porin
VTGSVRRHKIMNYAFGRCGFLLLCIALASWAVPRPLGAQTLPDNSSSSPSIASAASSDDQAPEADDPSSNTSTSSVTLFPHSQTSRYWISGQANIILQWHSTFPAPYSGPNSLLPAAQSATSKVYTLYLGYQLTSTTEVFLDIESAEGRALSNALGVAGFMNLDVVRNPSLSQAPYIARVMIRQVIPLSSERIETDRGPLSLATSLPVRRIELRFGKFSLVDFFDLNSYGTDSHLQFLNWTIDNDGAYDYAANTRGYTDGLMIEYDDHWFSARFAETLMPKVANGIYLDADIARAGAANLEFAAHGNRIHHRPGAVRFLTYLNRADMGNYRESIEEYLSDKISTPDITATRKQGRHKYGFDLNLEQSLFGSVSAFGRLGWSDGHNESFAYTECDRTVEFGGFTWGNPWHRNYDRAGAAFNLNAIVAAHQQYLGLGGLGFLLGDGALRYGHEKIVEGFYTAHLWRGFYASFDFQHINNPGYNKARGPVIVPSVRFHVDF